MTRTEGESFISAWLRGDLEATPAQLNAAFDAAEAPFDPPRIGIWHRPADGWIDLVRQPTA